MSTNQSIGENVRRLRKQRGLTVQQLAEMMEGSPHFTSIARMERGTQAITIDWMQRVADALGVPVTALIDNVDFEPIRRVPLIGAIAAGNWREAIHDPIGMIPCTVGGPNTFGLELKGDSMNRVIPEGAHVYVDPDDFEMRDGKIYAVMNSAGETTCKRFNSARFQFEPDSTNPEHLPIVMGREPFTVVGRVVGMGSEL